MGLADRIIRTTASLALIELVACKKLPTSLKTGLLLVSGVFLGTSLIGSCPAYSVLGISSKSGNDINDDDVPKRVF